MTYKRKAGFEHKCNGWIMQGVFPSGSDHKNAPYGTHAKCISCNISYPLDSINKMKCLCCNKPLRTRARSKKSKEYFRKWQHDHTHSESMLKAMETFKENKKKDILKKVWNKLTSNQLPNGVIDLSTKADREMACRYLRRKRDLKARRDKNKIWKRDQNIIRAGALHGNTLVTKHAVYTKSKNGQAWVKL